MSSEQDRAARPSALARHLNGQHPGTVLLLARYAAGGRPDAGAAVVVDVTADGLALIVTTPDGDAPVQLRFGPGEAADDLRRRLGGLLRATRAGLSDDGSVPLTSLEAQLAGGGRGPHGSARHQPSTGERQAGDLA